jgi:hypothetical protein
MRVSWKENGAENGIFGLYEIHTIFRTHELLQEWITHGSQAVDLNDLESTAVDRAWLSRHVDSFLPLHYKAISVYLENSFGLCF